MYAGLCVAFLVAEALGEGFQGCFGGVVGRVAGWVGDALFRAREDDGGSAGGWDERKESGEAMGDA